MKRISIPFLLCLLFLFVFNDIYAQDPPGIDWADRFPGAYETGNYTANDVKQSPYGGYVMVGSRSLTYQSLGYHEAMIMRVDEEGFEISMQQTSTGTGNGGFPWDQELNDMIITPMPYITYLATGFRDVTLNNSESPPGLLLMEMAGDGRVLFDSLYYNNNLHHVTGHCIQPAIGGGYIITGEFREDGGGTSQSFVTRLAKNEYDEYVFLDSPVIKAIPAGQNGYATWIRQFGGGYLLGGSAFTSPNTKFDLFLQKLNEDYTEAWTRAYGGIDSDEFADALIHGDTVYLAGTKGIPVSGTDYFKDQIYVARLNAAGEVDWEKTYGGTHRHFANKIMRTGEGDLLVAGFYYDASMHSQMILMKIDAENGDSLWTQDYGDFYSAGFRDAIRTKDFGYLTIGRASTSATQDPRVYAMKLDNSSDRTSLLTERDDLGLNIVAGSSVQDVLSVSGDLYNTFGLSVTIDSLLHPSVGDLEISLEHAGINVKLIDRPPHSGENFLHTTLLDVAETLIAKGYAPYSGWYLPEEPLLPFLNHLPIGDWTLTVTDHGIGSRKATSRVLEGWSLNLLTESGSGTGIPVEEQLAGFGLEQIRPNPVGEEALVSFRIARPGPVKLRVYNQLGQLVDQVVDEDLPEGLHERSWQPASLAPGTYFFHLESGGMISVRKAMLAR